MQEDIKGTLAQTPGVSLVHGDLLYRLRRRIGLIPVCARASSGESAHESADLMTRLSGIQNGERR
jgi:hypothetical protein